jgi:pentafunctional AROM polypeptide
MITCLSRLGAAFAPSADGAAVEVTGTGGRFAIPPASQQPLYVGNAGTASRFLTAVLCLLPYPTSVTPTPVVLRGNARMNERPIGPLVDALRAQGAAIRYLGKEGCPPLQFTAGVGAVPAGAARRVVHLEAKLSSQYVSAILMAAPYFPPPAGAPADSEAGWTEVVLAEEHPTSLPYIDMTRATMADFGVRVVKVADNRYLVPHTPYLPPAAAAAAGAAAGGGGSDAAHAAVAGAFAVEADASSASYPAAMALVTGEQEGARGGGGGP